MEEPGEEQKGEQLTETERMELERHMLYLAYENSYRVLTSKVDFTDLLEEKDILGMSALMAYDPTLGITGEELDNMIAYYVELDEPHYYMRCAELKKIKDELPAN